MTIVRQGGPTAVRVGVDTEVKPGPTTTTIPGVVGIPGLGGQAPVYHFAVTIPSDTWVIAHNLGTYPSVVVIDSAGDTVWGHVKYDSANQLTVTFSAPFSGDAYLT